jgi:hypothetical protein
MNGCGDGFQHLEEANLSLDSAVEDFGNADSLVEAGHAAADVLDAFGESFEGVVDVTCMGGIGEELEDIGRLGGEIIEAGSAITGEVVELITETSLAVAEPLISEMGELIQDAGEAVESATTAIEHAMAGEMGEAAASAADSVMEIPDVLGDIVGTVSEMGIGAAGEVLEGVFEIGGEAIEGVGEISGLTDDNMIHRGDHE